MHAEARHLLHTSLEQTLGAQPAVILMDELTACATKDDLRELEGRLVHEMDLRFGVVDERFATLKQHFDVIDERFKQVDKHFDVIDERFKQVDKRFDQIDERFAQNDERLGRIETQLDTLNDRFLGLLSGVHAEMRKTTQTLFFQMIAFAVVVFVAAGVMQR